MKWLASRNSCIFDFLRRKENLQKTFPPLLCYWNNQITTENSFVEITNLFSECYAFRFKLAKSERTRVCFQGISSINFPFFQLCCRIKWLEFGFALMNNLVALWKTLIVGGATTAGEISFKYRECHGCCCRLRKTSLFFILEFMQFNVALI